MKFTALKVIALACSVSAFSACGPNAGKEIVKSAKFTLEDAQDGVWATVATTVNTGGVSLPYSTIPIPDPRRPDVIVGKLSVDPSHITISVNVNTIAQVEFFDGKKLPNGNPIPIILPDGVIPHAIPISGGSTRLYFAVKGGTIMLGTGIVVNSSKSIPMDFFLPFDLGSGVKGSAGVFAGQDQGIGVFAMKTGMKLQDSYQGMGLAMAKSAKASSGKFSARDYNASNSKLRKLYNRVNSMGRVQIR